MTTADPRGRKVEHAEVIEASANKIWQVLSDLPGYEAWNPLITKASGVLRVGQPLTLSITLPGMKPSIARPTVVSVEENKGYRYATVGAGGLMRAHRYVVIEPKDGAHCTIRNGEIFAGVIGRLIAMLMGRVIGKGMAEMNHALKATVEARRD